MQIFIFRSVCMKLVDLHMNLYQEAALSLMQEFGDSCLKTLTYDNIKPRVHNLGCMYPLG